MDIEERSAVEPLTLDRAIELAREVVAEKGEDFVYQEDPKRGTCYVHTGDVPGCLVGHILLRHGVPMEALKAYNSLSVELLIEDTHWPLRDAEETLRAMQSAQDAGIPWGRVVEAQMVMCDGEGNDV